MKILIKKWVIFLAAILVLFGIAYAQATKSETLKTVKLPDGEEVLDLNGEWDAVIEHYGRWASLGSTRNVIKISQEGSLFKAIRLQDDTGATSTRRKGSMLMQGELDKSGFKMIYYIDGSARLLPCTGQLSEAGDKIKIDEGFVVRMTLTRK